MNDASVDLDLVRRGDRDFVTLVAKRAHRLVVHSAVFDLRQAGNGLQQRCTRRVAGGLFVFHEIPRCGRDIRILSQMARSASRRETEWWGSGDRDAQRPATHSGPRRTAALAAQYKGVQSASSRDSIRRSWDQVAADLRA